jgi:hypothetical protein
MIELLHDPSSEASRRVAEVLAGMTVAHTVTNDPEALPEGAEAPVIREGDRVVSGPEAIDDYLRELTAYLREWGRFQSDSCYIGDDGCVV